MATSSSKIQVKCACGVGLGIPSSRAGTTVTCPQCGQPVAVPSAGGANWYIARDKQKYGPYPAAQMRQMAAAGQLVPQDMVLREGQPRWVEAASVKGLFPAPVAAPLATLVPSEPPRRPKRWFLLAGGAAAVLVLGIVVA